MRCLTILVLGFFLASATSSAGQAVQTGDRGAEIYNKAAVSVFLLYVVSDDGSPIAQGSGFLIADKKIKTNRHVGKAAVSS